MVAKKTTTVEAGPEWVAPTKDRSGHPMFYELLDVMAEIHSKKNKDYGNGNPLGNFESVKQIGLTPFTGVVVRMLDKVARICSLIRKPDMSGHVQDESIVDTLIDLANYSLLAIVCLQEEREPQSFHAASTSPSSMNFFVEPGEVKQNV